MPAYTPNGTSGDVVSSLSDKRAWSRPDVPSSSICTDASLALASLLIVIRYVQYAAGNQCTALIQTISYNASTSWWDLGEFGEFDDILWGGLLTLNNL